MYFNPIRMPANDGPGYVGSRPAYIIMPTFRNALRGTVFVRRCTARTERRKLLSGRPFPSVSRKNGTIAGSIRSSMGFSEMLEKVFVVVALLLFAGAVLPLLQLRQPAGLTGAQEGGDLLSQLAFLGIYTVSALLILPRWRGVVYLVKRNKALVFLVGIALLSVLWSVSPEITLLRVLAVVGTTLFGAYFATRYSLDQQLQLLACAIGLAAVLSLVVALTMPYYGVQHEVYNPSLPEVSVDGWRGIFAHKNTLGRLMVLGAIVFLLLALGGRRFRPIAWSGFILSIVLLLLSNSITALFVFLIFLILLPLCWSLRWRYTLMIPFFITIVLLGGGALVWLLSHAESILGMLGKDTTLTGRTGLWSAVIDMIWQRPLLGYGYSGFWLGWEGESSYVWRVAGVKAVQAHNGFLELWLNLGLLGVLAFSALFLLSFLRAIAWARWTQTVRGFWPLFYLEFMLLFSLTENTILSRNSIFWVLFVSIVFSTTVQQVRERRKKHVIRLRSKVRATHG